MRARRGAALAIAALLTAAAPAASAYDHVARAGETLDRLALDYYGAASFAMILRAANGFLHADDGRLLEGERVRIPEVTYHAVKAGETWESLAETHLGTPRRGRFLAELNGAAPASVPVAGQIVKIPYQLLYVLAPNEKPKAVAAQYLGPGFSADWLLAYNLRKKHKPLGRGAAILIPLVNVELTAAAKARIRGAGQQPGQTAEDKAFQERAARDLAALREDYAQGRYVRVVAEAQRLLGTGKLTVPQQVGVFKLLASAYVAFGDREAAVAAFAQALARQPDMELSPITTSPKILDAFRAAQARVAPPKPTEP